MIDCPSTSECDGAAALARIALEPGSASAYFNLGVAFERRSDQYWAAGLLHDSDAASVQSCAAYGKALELASVDPSAAAQIAGVDYPHCVGMPSLSGSKNVMRQ